MPGIKEYRTLTHGATAPAGQDLYESNLQLNRTEFALRRICLVSMPRYLSVVLGTRCNIDCPYCYQTKSDDTLLGKEQLGDQLRRELSAFYPYLSTLRIGGGEVFLIPGFEELVSEVSAVVQRPIISVSTNGTLIDDEWARRIVELPFQGITVSIDGATPETYARLRRGASLDRVLGNVRTLQDVKSRCNSRFPEIDFFFLVMRSNYREIPSFLQLATEHGIERVSFQMMFVDHRNLGREPGLAAEVAFGPGEVREFHELTKCALREHRSRFRSINLSGFHCLFEAHNLSTDFLDEARFSVYPDNVPDGSAAPPAHTAAEGIEPCPNPWTLMYVTETGKVHVCSMSSSVGNIYETPLIRLWNSPGAMAARSDIINGRYSSAGCSKWWCSWREGKGSSQPATSETRAYIKEFTRLTQTSLNFRALTPGPPDSDTMLSSVRRMLTERNQRISELEANLRVLELERPGRKVELSTEVHFKRGLLAKFRKKLAIGSAVRAIQLLERTSNALRRWVNRLCR